MNEALIWSSEFSVGNDEIDHQHRRLLDTANMVRMFTGDEEHEVILAALDEVADYSLHHLSFEEAILAQGNFPGFDRHKALHDEIRECVHTLCINRNFVTAEMLNDVMTRLVKHIMYTDKEYVGYFDELHFIEDAS
jgi:hemerythrin